MFNNNYENYGQNPFNYPMQQPVIQPSFIYYPQHLPVISPVLNQEAEIANQAYLQLYHSDFKVMAVLPSLNLDTKSIQILKQIEQGSKRGVVNGLLTLMIKVLQVVGKLALGIVVGFSIALVASVLLNLPVAAILVSLAIVSRSLMTVILVGIVCKVSALALQDVRKRWREHSFQVAIQAEQTEVQNLKSWIQVKDLSEIEKRIRDTKGKIKLAQQTAGPSLLRGDQLFYLNSLLIKIADFRRIEKELDIENSMPLLNRYLAN